MTLARLALWVLVIGLTGFLAGLLIEALPLPLNLALGIGIAYLLPITVVARSSVLLRSWNYAAGPVILFIAFVCAALGNYASYRWGLWGLSYSNYDSDDWGGVTQLRLRLWVSLFTAVPLGVIVAVLASAWRSRPGDVNGPTSRQ